MTDREILDLILQKISGLEEKIGGLEEKTGGLEEKTGGLEEKIGGLEEKIGGLETEMQKVNNRLDVLEVKQDRTTKKLNDLQLDVKIAEREIRRDISALNDEMGTVIEILKLNELVP